MNIDWESRLFRANQSRGLSGGQYSSDLADEESSSFYNFRLRRHQSASPLLNKPLAIWGSSDAPDGYRGLTQHVADEANDGVLDYTDVLIILSRNDFEQTDENWLRRAEQILTFSFANYCETNQIKSPFPERPLGVHILCDGSSEVNGQFFGLTKNQFITGLVPNLYTQPLPDSSIELTIHAAAPGVWDGFREVGQFYNDQAMFTVGTHWLDNFQHKALQHPAIYQIYRNKNGDFHHMINPDLHGKYLLSTCTQDGIDLIVIADRAGTPIVYFTLSLVGTNVGSLQNAVTLDEIGSETLIPSLPSNRIFGLKECGALLQKVHFKRFMEGYDVYLSVDGNLTTIADNIAAIFEVRRTHVALSAQISDLTIDGNTLDKGDKIELVNTHTIQLPGHTIEYVNLKTRGIQGWPYVGEIRRPASSVYIPWGQSYQVGRSRDCRVALPDETNNTNIKWLDTVSSGAMIQSKAGDIEKAKFYTDSIMVGSQHGQIDLTQHEPIFSSINKNCFAFIRRSNAIYSLYPTRTEEGRHEAELEAGDELLIGNCLFQVSFETPGQTRPPIPPPNLALEGTAQSFNDNSPAENSWFNEQEDAVPMDEDAVPMEEDAVSMEEDAVSMEEDAVSIEEDAVSIEEDAVSMEEDVVAFDDKSDSADELSSDDAAFDVPSLPPRSTPPEPSRTESPNSLPPHSAAPEVSFDEAPPRATPPARISSGDLPSLSIAPPPLTLDADAIPAAAGLGEKGEAPSPLDFEPAGYDSIIGESLNDIRAQAREILAAQKVKTESVEPISLPPDADLPSKPPMISWDDSSLEPISMLDEAPVDSSDETPADASDEAPVDSSDETPADSSDETPADSSNQPPEPAEVNSVDLSDEPSATIPALGNLSDTPITPEALSPLPVQNLPKVQEVGEEPPAAEEQLSPHATLAPKIPENAEGWGSVLAIHENSAKFELGRSLHIVHIGWMVNGTCVIGNHSNCDALIPESQLNDKQEFLPMDYFALRVRGRRGALTVLEADEVYINGNSPEKEDYDDFTDLNFEIIRRDDQLNEDFTVSLHLTEDRTLPDPRARLLQIDCEDPLAASLFTHGLPTRTPRTLSYGPIEITMLFDGDSVTLSDYLTGYKSETGFHPFFIQQNDARFKTAPEDGIAVTLNAGDKFMVGASIYQVKKG